MSPANKGYRFRTADEGRWAILTLCDTHYHVDSFAPLEEQFLALEADDPSRPVIVDMTSVRLFSSTALRAMMTAYRRVSSAGGRIVAAGGGEIVANFLRFAPFIDHYATVEEARAALSARAPEQ